MREKRRRWFKLKQDLCRFILNFTINIHTNTNKVNLKQFWVWCSIPVYFKLDDKYTPYGLFQT
jgi:hypothetical protein